MVGGGKKSTGKSKQKEKISGAFVNKPNKREKRTFLKPDEGIVSALQVGKGTLLGGDSHKEDQCRGSKELSCPHKNQKKVFSRSRRSRGGLHQIQVKPEGSCWWQM